MFRVAPLVLMVGPLVLRAASLGLTVPPVWIILVRGVYSSIIPPPQGGERNQRLLGLGKKIKE